MLEVRYPRYCAFERSGDRALTPLGDKVFVIPPCSKIKTSRRMIAAQNKYCSLNKCFRISYQTQDTCQGQCFSGVAVYVLPACMSTD